MEHTTEKIRIATGVLTPLVAVGTFGSGTALSTAYGRDFSRNLAAAMDRGMGFE